MWPQRLLVKDVVNAPVPRSLVSLCLGCLPGHILYLRLESLGLVADIELHHFDVGDFGADVANPPLKLALSRSDLLKPTGQLS